MPETTDRTQVRHNRVLPEQWGLIRMGDAEKADEARIEDFHWLDDPGWLAAGCRIRWNAITGWASTTCSISATLWVPGGNLIWEKMMTEFTVEMHNKLDNYVYRLVDPRDGSTFYVGRGHGNRVFDHVKGAVRTADEKTENLRQETINTILSLDLKPIHVIHRHGMSLREAQLAEAVLIDAYPGLTNIAAGKGSNDYGPANAEELVKRYGAKEIEFEQGRKIMVIKIRWSTVEACEPREGIAEHDPVYEAVRSSWTVSERRANQAEHVLAVVEGICRGVYVPEGHWKKAPTPPEKRQRWEFDGRKADPRAWKRYVGNRLPDRMRKKGMALPFLYEGY